MGAESGSSSKNPPPPSRGVDKWVMACSKGPLISCHHTVSPEPGSWSSWATAKPWPEWWQNTGQGEAVSSREKPTTLLAFPVLLLLWLAKANYGMLQRSHRWKLRVRRKSQTSRAIWTGPPRWALCWDLTEVWVGNLAHARSALHRLSLCWRKFQKSFLCRFLCSIFLFLSFKCVIIPS